MKRVLMLSTVASLQDQFNMANIRRKIESDPAQPEYIFTEVGVGYRMAEDEEE